MLRDAAREATSDSVAPIGYGRQSVSEEDVEAVVRVLRGERLTQGPAVRAFEGALAERTGASHVAAVANGTVALQLAYLALGVRDGARVLTTANTFLATATAALHCGAEVDFLDIDPHTGNLDLDALERALDAGDVPDVVTIVHFAGLPCDMERVLALKRRFGFRLVEDAAHALGATYLEGGRRWTVGGHPEVDATTLSFHPVKHVTTGEGGAVLTQSDELAARVARLRDHGIDRSAASTSFAPMIELGLNARMGDLSAALGTSQLARLDAFLARRRTLAARYYEALTDVAGLTLLDRGDDAREHAWHLFVARVDDALATDARDGLLVYLRQQEIHAQLHYHPVPRQPWFRARSDGAWPVAERHGRCAISLPLHAALSDDDQARVVHALRRWSSRRAVA